MQPSNKAATAVGTFLATAVLTPFASAQGPTLTGTTVDFTSSSAVSVGYDPNAATGFDDLTNVSNTVAYTFTTGADQNYVYGLFQIAPGQDPSKAVDFSNVYLSTVNNSDGQGSNLGFELNNRRAFLATDDTVTYRNFASSELTLFDQPGTIEFAIPWTYFLNDPDNVGFTRTSLTNSTLQFRLSQTFGYSVAGGAAYGDARLGRVNYNAATPAPEPSSVAAFAFTGLGAAGLILRARRRRASTA